jgi:hypothetical protein
MGWFSLSLKKVLAFFAKIFDSEEGKQMLVGICSTVLGITEEKAADLWETLEVLAQQAYLNFPASGTGQQKYDWLLEQLKQMGIKAKPFVIDYILHQVLGFLAKQGKKI